MFENHEDMEAQVDQDYLPIDRNTVLVMKNGGPKGRPDFRNGVGSRCRRMLLTAGDQRRGPDLRRADERHKLSAQSCCTWRRNRQSAGR